MAYCAVYDAEFSDTAPCPHCQMERADPSEFHWAGRDICEFRGGWYWTDETDNFGNAKPCATQAEAEAQQTLYAQSL